MILAFLPLASLSSIIAAQGQGAGRVDYQPPSTFGFHQNVAVLLKRSKI